MLRGKLDWKPAVLLPTLLLSQGLLTGAAHSQPRPSALEWPPVRQETKPWTRWWWLGNVMEKRDLSTEMAEYARAGLGGLEITPIYGVRGYERRFIPYLSPEWMEMLAYTLREADRLELGVDVATGTGWPFGGPWVGPDEACRNVVPQTYKLRGGERLQEPVRHVQRPYVRAVGRRVQIGDLKEPVSANPDLQALALEQVRFPKPLPLALLMAYSDGGQKVDLTSRVGADGTLDWTAPAGEWTLYALFQGWHGKLVERAGPGGEGDVIDHFSRRALTAYLARFDQAFGGKAPRGIRTYFNDSYEVDDANGNSNWTPDFLAEFKRRRGYDLRDQLPAFFGTASPDLNARVASDYRETLSDLLLDEFTVPWQRWAAGKGAGIRNQAHGSPANILDLYAASDIPETEGEDLLRMKFASSAAHVTGKRLTAAEAATWLDEHFQGTLGEVKATVDRYFIGGVNHIVYHGTPFSPPGEEWPGFLFYASVHFGPTNSFWPDFSALNGYVARCQSFLQAGRPDNDVLVYYPVHEAWARGAATTLPHFAGPDGTPARAEGEALLRAGYGFDYVSDRQVRDLEETGGRLRTGGVSYRVVLVPPCRRMPLETMQRLVELARRGATVVFRGDLPADVPGLDSLEQRRQALRDLTTGLQLGAAAPDGVRSARVGRGRILVGADVKSALTAAGVRREALVDRGLQFVRRRDGRGPVYFLQNTGKTAFQGWLPLSVAARGAALFDPMQATSGAGAVRPTAEGGSELYLQLQPGETCILRALTSRLQGRAFPHYEAAAGPRPLAGTWSVRFERGGPELPAPVRRTELGSWTSFGGDAVKRFSGTAVYTLSFERPQEAADAWLLDLGGVGESARVRLNGKEVAALISAPFQVRLPREALEARNTLEVTVSNLMANRIADLDRHGVRWKKFYNVNFPARKAENRGPDGLFSAARWEPQPSGLLGPVTLTPLRTFLPK